ncbi:Hypothetical predicted protein [Mytilus galloprovincialis]|uniref:Uncharacterized protein n=1 Tax=Mytilus galloprovincialis TaxID=29158 RepID=A0A8B6EL78_MYTGA|nr:Hypothetical predicted protein [Mytilus galloprovincialis]
MWFFSAFGDHIGQFISHLTPSRNDYGLSKQSVPRYIRQHVQKQSQLIQDKSLILRHLVSHELSSGVICQLTVKTTDQSPLRIRRIWIDIQNTTACNSDFLKFTATKIERICGTSQSSSTMIFSKSIAEVTFVSDIELTTAVFPYQPKRNINVLPFLHLYEQLLGSQVEQRLEELSFSTNNSLSSTIMFKPSSIRKNVMITSPPTIDHVTTTMTMFTTTYDNPHITHTTV